MGGLGWRVLMGPLPGTPPDIEAMNLFWSLYNCLVLFIACMICVEQPRFRSEERFIADEEVTLIDSGGTLPKANPARASTSLGVRPSSRRRSARAATTPAI